MGSSTAQAFCGVTCVSRVDVQLDEAPWAFATQRSEAISAFWREKQKSHPHFYDGQVHVMTSWEIRNFQTSAAVFVGNLCRTNFASFLYWKESNGKMEGEADFSGGGALLCADGGLLMALSGKRAIVPGTLEFPSGFVDVADFEGDKLDFDRHVEREVMEELDITRAQLGKSKHYLVSAADEIVQIVSVFDVATNGMEFARRWRSLTAHSQSEIADVVAIYGHSDFAGYPVQAHVKAAASYLLALSCSSRSIRADHEH